MIIPPPKDGYAHTRAESEKLTDSRCGKYIREYGYESWELDALEPSVLDNLISETILCYLDKPLYDSMARKEDKIKDELLTYARAFRTD